jgi:hypothetical protein
MNCEDLPGGEIRYLNEYAVRWANVSKQVSEFFQAALGHDAGSQTDVAHSMLRQIQFIGNNACASDGRVKPAANQVVQRYVEFLETKLEVVQPPRIIVEVSPPVLAASVIQPRTYAAVPSARFT